MHEAQAGDRARAGRTTAAGAWVPLALVAPGRRDLRRPIAMVGMAAVMMLAAWWAATGVSEASSTPSADRATLIMWVSPPTAAMFVTMAAGRFLVSMRAVAALYGRARPQGVEIAGFLGRLGWPPARRLIAPGQVFLHVGVGGPGAMPMHHLRLAQGRATLTVTADSWWEDATVPGIVAWLARHGIAAVPFPGLMGPAGPRVP